MARFQPGAIAMNEVDSSRVEHVSFQGATKMAAKDRVVAWEQTKKNPLVQDNVPRSEAAGLRRFPSSRYSLVCVTLL